MRQRERGFALPLAAAAIALLAVALGVAADALSGASAAGRREEARWRLELAAATLEARLAHLVLTAPLEPRALQIPGAPLILDGRPYLAQVDGVGAFTVSVQDEAGLFNLNTPEELAVARLLRGAGVQEWRAETLAGALADFTDGDDLRRLNGAEAREYAAAGRSGPANAPLVDPGDAWRALGWDMLNSRATRALLARVATGDPARPFNPNTAPEDVLAATFALDARGVERLVALRETRTIVSFADAAEVAGVAVAPGEIPVAGQPARDLRATVAYRGQQGSSIYVLHLRVAEAEAGAPVATQRLVASARDWERRLVNGRLDGLPDSPAVLDARERGIRRLRRGVGEP